MRSTSAIENAELAILEAIELVTGDDDNPDRLAGYRLALEASIRYWLTVRARGAVIEQMDTIDMTGEQLTELLSGMEAT